jgi:hypothetical protein
MRMILWQLASSCIIRNLEYSSNQFDFDFVVVDRQQFGQMEQLRWGHRIWLAGWLTLVLCLLSLIIIVMVFYLWWSTRLGNCTEKHSSYALQDFVSTGESALITIYTIFSHELNSFVCFPSIPGLWHQHVQTTGKPNQNTWGSTACTKCNVVVAYCDLSVHCIN